MATYYKKLAFLAVAVFIAVVSAGQAAPIYAEDKAQLIFSLAQKLFDENVKAHGYTYWVGGNIGMPEDAQRPKGVAVGQAIPKFTFREFDGKASFTNETLTGPYVLNFWASWCGPCRNEFPLLVNAMEEESLTVPVYFVNTGELSKSDAQFFLLQYAKKVKVLTDSRSKFGNAVGLNFIPVTLLIDAEGNVQAMQPGEISALGVEFFAAIAENPGIGAFDWTKPNKMPTTKK
ncbi:MAG: TlpA family protein disulfide reductase [Anaerolineae bacterium]|nr:TlpA family protein disulfide reductase [Anaerolineae bacterium]